MEYEISVLAWRVGAGDPSGVHVWFDPYRESVRLFRTPTPDSDACRADLTSGVDTGGPGNQVDSVVSVSALESEARAVAGNEALNRLDLEGPSFDQLSLLKEV